MQRLPALVAATLLATGCAEVIETGHRGIEVNFGEVIGAPLPEGFYWYNPFTTDIVQMDTRMLRMPMETTAYTRDVQQAKLQVVLNYRLDQAAVTDVYKNVGHDWDAKLVPQAVQNALKDAIGKWDAENLIANRDKARAEIEAKTGEALAAKHILLSSLDITDIEYTAEFERAVEAKVVATQRAIEEANRTKQIEEQAKQKVTQAEAEAESIRIRAKALEQNAKLVELEAVQKWDGHLPQYMMGNSVPFLNLGTSK